MSVIILPGSEEFDELEKLRSKKRSNQIEYHGEVWQYNHFRRKDDPYWERVGQAEKLQDVLSPELQDLPTNVIEAYKYTD